MCNDSPLWISVNLEKMASCFVLFPNVIHYSITATERYSSVKICFAIQNQTLTQRYHSHKKILEQAAAHLSLWLGSGRPHSFPASSLLFLYGSHLKEARCLAKYSLWIRDTLLIVFGLVYASWLGILVHSITTTGFF